MKIIFQNVLNKSRYAIMLNDICLKSGEFSIHEESSSQEIIINNKIYNKILQEYKLLCFLNKFEKSEPLEVLKLSINVSKQGFLPFRFQCYIKDFDDDMPKQTLNLYVINDKPYSI